MEAFILMASLIRKCQMSNNLFNPQIETKDQKSSVHVKTWRKWPEASLGSGTALSDPLFHDEMGSYSFVENLRVMLSGKLG